MDSDWIFPSKISIFNSSRNTQLPQLLYINPLNPPDCGTSLSFLSFSYYRLCLSSCRSLPLPRFRCGLVVSRVSHSLNYSDFCYCLLGVWFPCLTLAHDFILFPMLGFFWVSNFSSFIFPGLLYLSIGLQSGFVLFWTNIGKNCLLVWGVILSEFWLLFYFSIYMPFCVKLDGFIVIFSKMHVLVDSLPQSD